ncbi:MAG: THUMP domain-containing protein [Candidatus Thorarchaeota archaeon]
MQDFNLLVSTPRNRERAAISEVRYFVADLLEDDELEIEQTNVSGLVTCKTSLDPFEVVHKLEEFAEQNPFQFRFAIKFTPLEICVESDIDKMVEATEKLRNKIDENETFRVTVRKRYSDLAHMEIVDEVAEVISNEVDLEEPDKTVWLEVIGDRTGISVLSEEQDILSIMPMRDE